MVTVAVLAILATVAYPLYTQHVQKSRRSDARVALAAIAQAQERFFTVNGRYATLADLDDPNGDGDDADSVVDPLLARLDRNSDGTPDTYTLVVNATTTTYDITATAVGSQAGDDCSVLTVDHRGLHAGTGSGCW
jgi:type IV pilus assembly protein PilE